MTQTLAIGDPSTIGERMATLPWQAIGNDLTTQGYALTGALLSRTECTELISLYQDPIHFRRRITMQHHGFGSGEYQYFTYPLPAIVTALRHAIYSSLVPLANHWQRILGNDSIFPETLPAFLETCHRAKQTRPTPLLLKYQSGDFNCLHQDLYGALMFPFQMVVLLSEPGEDFSGGEFVLVEQKPRAQSKAEVVSLHRGEAIIFAVNHRPVKGTRGFYRVNLKHGVSRIHTGYRHSLGIILHDAT